MKRAEKDTTINPINTNESIRHSKEGMGHVGTVMNTLSQRAALVRELMLAQQTS